MNQRKYFGTDGIRGMVGQWPISADFMLRLGRAVGSVLARDGTDRPKVLIGGLDMGFTLRAALTVLPDDAEVVVAELVPAVVAWARGPMAEVFKGCLDDPRVTIFEGDVGEAIRAAKAGFDAILLDVDNGPDGLTRKSNDRLYDYGGINAAKAALRGGGVLAVWSSGPDTSFTRRLKDGGFATEAVSTRAGNGRGARHASQRFPE